MHDARGAQNGYAADDAEAWVPCFLCDFFAAGNRYGDDEIGGEAVFSAYCLTYFCHHAAWNRVDRRLAGDGEPLARDRADAFARAKDDAGAGRGGIDRRDDGCAMRYIRVVARILDDARHGIAFAQSLIGKLEIGYFALGQNNAHRIGKFAGDKRRQGSSLGGGCRASARRPAAPKFCFFRVLFAGVVSSFMDDL